MSGNCKNASNQLYVVQTLKMNGKNLHRFVSDLTKLIIQSKETERCKWGYVKTRCANELATKKFNANQGSN